MTMKNKIEEAALSYGKKENCPAPNENPYITKKCEEAITVHFKRGASFALSELVPLLRECRDAIQDQLARANQAIETDCPQCDYQCGGCIRSIDDMESMKKRIDATLDGIEGEKKWK